MVENFCFSLKKYYAVSYIFFSTHNPYESIYQDSEDGLGTTDNLVNNGVKVSEQTILSFFNS